MCQSSKVIKTQEKEASIKIQQYWRQYQDRKHLTILRKKMADIYFLVSKDRMLESYCRPYKRQYLQDQEDTRQGILSILEYYNDIKKIQFMDIIRKVYTSKDKSSKEVDVLPRILVLTTKAAYIMKKQDGMIVQNEYMELKKASAKVILCRRIPLAEINELSMSFYADPFLSLRVQQPLPLNIPDTSYWEDNKQVKRCPVTGKRFGLFTRRHHCRVTGMVFHKDALQNLSVVPDRGYYTPVPICEKVVGMESIELMEDQLWKSDKKSEIAAILQDCIETSLQKEIEITFSNSITLQPNQVAPQLSRSPAQKVDFLSPPTVPPAFIRRRSSYTSKAVDVAGTNERLIITAKESVPGEQVTVHHARQNARRKRASRAVVRPLMSNIST